MEPARSLRWRISAADRSSSISIRKTIRPGCTAQACGLRDAWSESRGARAKSFGVSVDSAASHEKFISKYHLPFPLLSDPDKKIVEAYGVWVEKSMYGKKYMGAERSTFVIDGDGRISAIFRKVKPDEHVAILEGGAPEIVAANEEVSCSPDASGACVALRESRHSEIPLWAL